MEKNTETNSKPLPAPGGFTFHDIWVLLYHFLLFMLVRQIAEYVFVFVGLRLNELTLPQAFRDFLFTGPGLSADEAALPFTGNLACIIQALGFGCGALAIVGNARKLILKVADETKLSHPEKEGAAAFFWMTVAVVGSVVGLNILLELSGVIDKSSAYSQVAESQYSADFLLGLIAFGVVSPIAEELLFRGVMHNYLRQVISPKFAMVFSSVLFGLYHMNYVQGIYGFVMGCLIAYAYEYFGEFKMAVSVHISANVIAYCLTYTALFETALFCWPVGIGFSLAAVVSLNLLARRKKVF